MDNKKKKKKKIGRYLVLALFLGIIVYITGNNLQNYVVKLPFFSVKQIQIRGNNLVDTDYLLSIAEPYLGKSIFEIDKSDLKLRYQAVSRIKEIECQKILPSKLIVKIKEREGLFFVLNQSGEYFPIDQDKIVLDKSDWYIREDLPLININIPKDKLVLGQAVDDRRIDFVFQVYELLVKADSRFITDISEFYLKNNELHLVDIKSKSIVIFNTNNLEEQIPRYFFIRENQGFKRNSIIDLRFNSQIIIS